MIFNLCIYKLTCFRSPNEPVSNVTVVEITNHNHVFNFNQMEQVINQTNQQSLLMSSEPLINSPRPSRPTNSSTSENVASTRQTSRHHQTRDSSISEEVPVARSSNNLDHHDRITNSEDIPQRSNGEIPIEDRQNNVRMAEPEEGGRPRRRVKRQEVVPAVTDQEITSNYEHLVLPTAMQSRPLPALSNFVPTDIALLPTRPQVKYLYTKHKIKMILIYGFFVATYWSRSRCSS